MDIGGLHLGTMEIIAVVILLVVLLWGVSRVRSGDKQGVCPGPRRIEHFKLVPARPPSAAREPLLDLGRKPAQTPSVPWSWRRSSSR